MQLPQLPAQHLANSSESAKATSGPMLNDQGTYTGLADLPD